MNEPMQLSDEQVKSLFYVTSSGYRFSISSGKLLVQAIHADAPIDDHVRAIIKKFKAEFTELTRIGGFQYGDKMSGNC